MSDRLDSRPELVDVGVIADMLGISRKIVLRMEREGKIPAVRMTSRTIRYEPEKVKKALGITG